jgi:hypothetical protein
MNMTKIKEKKRHRGKNSQDDKLFGSEEQQNLLREAVRDLSFLLNRGYAEKSASALVGNRYQIRKRQIQAVIRMSCGQQDMENRLAKHIMPELISGEKVSIDGFNLLIGLEVALSGGYLFEGVDSCFRDIAGVHGTYKTVSETLPALELVAKVFKDLDVTRVHWYFDQPVSNSGKMKALIYELAEKHKLNWTADTVHNPDNALAQKNEITVTSDAWILDRVDRWTNLLQYIVSNYIPKANVVRVFPMD